MSNPIKPILMQAFLLVAASLCCGCSQSGYQNALQLVVMKR